MTRIEKKVAIFMMCQQYLGMRVPIDCILALGNKFYIVYQDNGMGPLDFMLLNLVFDQVIELGGLPTFWGDYKKADKL